MPPVERISVPCSERALASSTIPVLSETLMRARLIGSSPSVLSGVMVG